MPRPRPRTFVAIELDADLKRGLDLVKERDGISISFQVARAIENWLEERGIEPVKKGGTKKARSRK
jgi:hypothetical protein